jgi:hypothetical protein
VKQTLDTVISVTRTCGKLVVENRGKPTENSEILLHINFVVTAVEPAGGVLGTRIQCATFGKQEFMKWFSRNFGPLLNQ